MLLAKGIKKIGFALIAFAILAMSAFLVAPKPTLNAYADEPPTSTWEEVVSAFNSIPIEIQGTGSSLNPFQIRNAVDFAIVSSLINRFPQTYSNSFYLLTNSFDLKNIGIVSLSYSSVGINILSESNLDLIRYYNPIGVTFATDVFFTGGLNFNRFAITGINTNPIYTSGQGKLQTFARREIGGIPVSVVRDLKSNGNYDSIRGWNLWSTNIEEPTGAGISAQNPYLISSPEHLAWITNRARYGTPFPNDTYFRLTQNIDLTGHIWDQIGTPSRPFNGIFDFSRYSVSNIVLEVGSQIVEEKNILFGSISFLGRVLNFVPSTYWSNSENYAESFDVGNGSVSQPYQIYTSSELARILALSKEGNTFSNVNFILKANLDLSLHRWEKIGSENAPFMGTFNYNGCTIINIDLGVQTGSAEPLDRWELFYKFSNGSQFIPSKASITNWNMWTSFASTGYAGGAGTQNDPFQISNAMQLSFLAKKQNENSSYSVGKYFVLTSIIDLSGHLWVQIGSLGSEFAGIFDYNKKSVKYISLESNLQNNTKEKELFGGEVVVNNLKNWVPSEYWHNLALPIPELVGNGSVSNPYEIYDPMQFFHTKFLTADYTVPSLDNHFKLVSSISQIDMDGYLWESITFHGTLDANRIQIVNLRQNITDGTGFFSDDSTGRITNWSPNQSWNSPDFVQAFFDGTGTSVSPFLISSASQLAYLMRETNYNSFATKGKHFVLTKNINLVNNFWMPIGTTSNPFRGIFNAANYSVINISVSTEAQRNGFMLFGNIEGATFNNISQTTSWAETQYRSGSYSSGMGTMENPYIIRTASELALLSYQTKTVSNFTVNKYFVLGNDISLVNHSWAPIGLPPEAGLGNDKVFAGNFDYAGYKVTNIYYAGSELVGNIGTKYELFHGLARDMEYEVTANISRWIPSGSWLTDGIVANYFAGGDGTTESPFLIETSDQLAYLSSIFNAGINSAYSAKAFKLGADIDLSDYLWTPIGTNANPFNGSFYGNGYTISGIVITDGILGGLFGVVKNLITPVVIQNFEISHVNMRLSANEGTRSAIGILAAIVENAEIKNIKTSGFVNSESILPFSVGGLIGFATTTNIQAVQSFADLNVVQKSIQGKETQLGGLIGFGNNVSIYNSYFAGKLSGTIATGSSTANKLVVGGLFGFVKGNASTSLFNSFSTAQITVSAIAGSVSLKGGIVGEVNTLSTERPADSEFGFCYFLSSSSFNPSLNAFGNVPGSFSVSATIQKKADISFFQTKATYTTSANWSNRSSWNFSTIWNEVVNEKNELPTLQSFGEYFVVVNNTGIAGGSLQFAFDDGVPIENDNPNSDIVQRKYRYEDKVRFYVVVQQHYLYSKIVKKNGITLQNVLNWETFIQNDVEYDSFEIVVNANTHGTYSIEFTTASYKLTLSVEEDEEEQTGGYIRIDNSDRFTSREINVPYQTNFILKTETKTDYAFVGWFVWIDEDPYATIPEEPEEPEESEEPEEPEEPFEPYWEFIEGSGLENFPVVMSGKNMAYMAQFTKNVSYITVTQIGGAGGIYSFRGTQSSATNLVGKLLLGVEGTISVEVKEGYTFLGWFLSEDDTEPFSTELEISMTSVDLNYSLFAKFIAPPIEEQPAFPWLTILLTVGGALIVVGLSVLIILKKKSASSSYRRNFRY